MKRMSSTSALRTMYRACSLALLIAQLAACSTVPTATPPPTATEAPATMVPPSPSPRLTSLPTPTLTPIGQVTRPAPTATATPRPTRLTSTPEPTADLSRVNPLTGLEVADASVLDRRPVAIKVSNYPPVVRPQWGLSYADVVFEHEAEARLTRFTAIFYGEGAERVGPVRSARIIDLEIPPMFDAFFAFSGAHPAIVRRIQQSDFADRVLSPDPNWNTEGFRRIPQPGLAYEHTLFTDTSTLWEIAERRGWNERPNLDGWTFDTSPPLDGQRAVRLSLVYQPDYVSTEYEYDWSAGGYRRYIWGEPHIDRLTGEQLVADNVIVLYVPHVSTDIVAYMTDPPTYSTEIQLWGEGRMQLFRDGRLVEGRWVRAHREDLVSFVDASGRPIALKPGHTWIQLVRPEFNVPVEGQEIDRDRRQRTGIQESLILPSPPTVGPGHVTLTGRDQTEYEEYTHRLPPGPHLEG